MSWKVTITITDNETGKVLLEQKEATAIICSSLGELGNKHLAVTNCTSTEMAKTIIETENLISRLYHEYPQVKAVVALQKVLRQCDEVLEG